MKYVPFATEAIYLYREGGYSSSDESSMGTSLSSSSIGASPSLSSSRALFVPLGPSAAPLGAASAAVGAGAATVAADGGALKIDF